MDDSTTIAAITPQWEETRTRRDSLADWNDCYSGGMGNLRYPDEVIVQTVHHLGLGAFLARKALDLGCGSGRHLELLHKRGYEVWAVDAADQALKLAQRRCEYPGVHVVKMRFPPVKFPDGFMDLVLMVNVLEHNVEADRISIVDEVYRILKDGGMYLSRHAGWMAGPPDGASKKIEERGWEREKDTFVHLATENEMLDMMAEAGFSFIQVGSRRGSYPWLPWQDEKEIYVVAVK
jgi:SAM-dependent methyltransferase